MLNRSVVAIAATIGFLFAPTPQADAEVIYRESMRDYNLKGDLRTPQQIWAAIRKYGMTETNASSIRVGWANWRIGVSHAHIRRGNLCSIANVKVKVDVIINVPKWNRQSSAKRSLRRFFTCVRRTVTTHEIRHGDIARETGKAIERAYWDWLVDVPCGQFQSRANEIFERQAERGKRAQAAFDTQDYARNRYRVCDRLGTGQEVAAYMPAEVNHPRRRTLRSGRPWVDRPLRLADNRDDNPRAEVVPVVAPGNGPGPDDDARTEQTDPEPPRAPAAGSRGSTERGGFLSVLPPEVRNSFIQRLSSTLTICGFIGLMVWYASKRLKARDIEKDRKGTTGRDFAGVDGSKDLGHGPTWALQAAAALEAYGPPDDAGGGASDMTGSNARRQRSKSSPAKPAHAPVFGKRGRAMRT